MVLEHRDVLMRGDGGQQRPLDLPSGDVLGMQDAALRVATLPAKVELALAVDFPLGELHAKLDQLVDSGRAFLDDTAHDRLIAQPAPGGERVAHMALERILLARHGGNATLRVVGIRLGPAFLRDDCNRAGVGHLERKRQPGDAAAQHQKIKLSRGIRHPLRESVRSQPAVVNEACLAEEHSQRHVRAPFYALGRLERLGVEKLDVVQLGQALLDHKPR